MPNRLTGRLARAQFTSELVLEGGALVLADQVRAPRSVAAPRRPASLPAVPPRDAFLLQKKREENWQRRAPLMHVLIGSGLRLTAAQQAEHAAFQAAMDYAAPIAPVPVDRLRDIFSNEGFVRTITTFV